MIKRGDSAKGFRFETSSGVRWNALMEPFVGVEGIVREVRVKMNELVIEFMTSNMSTETRTQLHKQFYVCDLTPIHWIYPLDEYMSLQREEKLKELGILD